MKGNDKVAELTEEDSRDIPDDHDPLQPQTDHQHKLEEDRIQLKMKKPEWATLAEINHLESHKNIEETKIGCFSRLCKIPVSATTLATATSSFSLKQISRLKFDPIKRFAIFKGAWKRDLVSNINNLNAQK